MHGLFFKANLILKILFSFFNSSHIYYMSFKSRPIIILTQFLVIFMLEYNSLYSSPNFLVISPPYFVSWRQIIIIFMLLITSTILIVLLVKVSIFQSVNLIILVLVQTKFCTRFRSIRCENLCSLNTTAKHHYNALCSLVNTPCIGIPYLSFLNVTQHRHIVSLITRDALYFYIKFRISEFLLRGVKKVFIRLATNKPNLLTLLLHLDNWACTGLEWHWQSSRSNQDTKKKIQSFFT